MSACMTSSIGLIYLSTSKKVLNHHHADLFPSKRGWSLGIIYVSHIISLSQRTHSWSPTRSHVGKGGGGEREENVQVMNIITIESWVHGLYNCLYSPPTHTHTPSHSFSPSPYTMYTPGSSSLSHSQYIHTPSLLPISTNHHHHPSHTHTCTTHLGDIAGGYSQKYTLSANPFEICTVAISAPWVPPLLPQGLDCLWARVVKLSRLPNRETTRS